MKRPLPRLLVAAVGAAAMCLASPAPGLNAVPVAAIPLYVAPSAQTAEPGRANIERAHRLRQLASGAFGKPEDFAIRAELEFETEKRTMADHFAFSPGLPAAAQLPPGWRAQGGFLSWRLPESGERAALTAALHMPSGAPAFRLHDFEEFWLDYSAVPSVAECAHDIELKVGLQPLGEPSAASREATFIARGAPPLETKAGVDAAGARWMEKDYTYLIRRELGMAPDDDWRFAQDGANAVVQRRMRQTLSQIEAIDVILTRQARLVQVNLRVMSGKAMVLLEFPALADPPPLPAGRPGLRLNVREALERRFPKQWAENERRPGRHPFVLTEIAVFLQGDARQVADLRALHGLALLGPGAEGPSAETAETAGAQKLPAKLVNHDAKRRRMVADLRPLAQRGEVEFKSVRLVLRPPAGSSCAIRIDGAHAATPFAADVPVFARRLEQWGRRWGPTSLLTSPSAGHVESPGIVAHLFFAAIGPPELRPEQRSIGLPPGEGRRPDPASASAPKPSLFRALDQNRNEVPVDDLRLTSSSGASLVSNGAAPTSAIEKGMLVLEGRSGPLEFTWPVSSWISERTWFVVAAEDSARELGGMVLALQLADGRVLRRNVTANVPQRLLDGAAQMRSATLTMTPLATPYRVKLAEMMFFEPREISFAEALLVRVPRPHRTLPRPQVISGGAAILEAGPGRVSGIAEALRLGESIEFVTPLDPELAVVRGMQLDYRLPASFLDGDGCPLRLRFEWANAKLERYLCLESREGSQFVPIANWIGTAGQARDLGALRSITWTFRAGAAGGRQAGEAFDLSFAVEGWSALSAADQLRTQPIFRTGEHEIHLPREEFERVTTGGFSGRFSVPLDASVLARVLAVGGHIEPVRTGPAVLERLLVEPRSAFPEPKWRELMDPPLPAAPPRWDKWLKWGAIALALWLVARRSGQLPRAAWRLTLPVRAPVRALLHRGAATAWRTTMRWHTAAHGAIAFLALGPGLWIAGRVGWTFAGAMVLGTSLLVGWAAYTRWRGTRPIVPTLLPILALACAIWALGRFGIDAAAAWAALPFLGLAYATSPSLERIAVWVPAHRRYFEAMMWALFAAALYLLGSRQAPSHEENYFFTVAAIGVVLAIRAALFGAEPSVRTAFPSAAESIYARPAGIYFTVALIALLATALLLALDRNASAAQAAVILYFALITAFVRAAVAIRRARGDPPTQAPGPG